MSRSNGSPTHAGGWPAQRPQQQRGEGERRGQLLCLSALRIPRCPAQGAAEPTRLRNLRSRSRSRAAPAILLRRWRRLSGHQPLRVSPRLWLRGYGHRRWRPHAARLRRAASRPARLRLRRLAGGTGERSARLRSRRLWRLGRAQEPAGWRGGAAEPRLDWNAHRRPRPTRRGARLRLRAPRRRSPARAGPPRARSSATRRTIRTPARSSRPTTSTRPASTSPRSRRGAAMVLVAGALAGAIAMGGASPMPTSRSSARRARKSPRPW